MAPVARPPVPGTTTGGPVVGRGSDPAQTSARELDDDSPKMAIPSGGSVAGGPAAAKAPPIPQATMAPPTTQARGTPGTPHVSEVLHAPEARIPVLDAPLDRLVAEPVASTRVPAVALALFVGATVVSLN
jgi:hypothetical protein